MFSFKCLPDSSITVPVEANADNLNTIVNKVLESVQGDTYEPVDFEFLISSALVRNTVKEIVEEYGIPTETVIPVECLTHEPAPVPESEISCSDWVGDVKTCDNHIFAASYNGSILCCTPHEKNPESAPLHNGAAKCVQIMPNTSGKRILSGGHDQVIMLSEVTDDSACGNLNPLAVFCGHERSVECIAVNNDGSRFISGSFDSYLKVWTTDLDDDSTNYKGKEQSSVKKRRVGITK
uniref:WD_REPEATS_REGION domain-containing protein n=1 Tax=Syphacia muris TaxID=451379 RepID=A0A0N5AYX9_9BILA